MYFDSLTHITADGRWYNTAHDATVSRLLNVCSRAHVSKALLVGMPNCAQEHILMASNTYRDLFIPIAGLNPTQFHDQNELFDYLNHLKQKGYRGVKLHPRFGKHLPDCKEVHWVLDSCAKLNMVVLLCTMWGPPTPLMTKSVKNTVHHLCEATNGATLILVHGCTTDILSISDIIVKYSNVLIDASYTIIKYIESSVRQDLEYLMKHCDKKLIIGSDFPEFTYDDVLKTIAKYFGDINKDKIDNVTFRNLDQIF